MFTDNLLNCKLFNLNQLITVSFLCFQQKRQNTSFQGTTNIRERLKHALSHTDKILRKTST